MATIIDSLVITLGLDPSGFKTGSRELDDVFKKLKDATVKHGKDIEESGKKIELSIASIAKVAGSLFALFIGGRGFKEFISDINESNAALGRFATTLGTSPQRVSELAMIIERMGGGAEDAKSAFESANKAVQEFSLGKGVPEAISRMTARVGGAVNFSNADRYLLTLASILKAYSEVDAAQEHFFAQQLGLSEGANLALIKYGATLASHEDALKGLAPTNEQIKSAQDLHAVWVESEQIVAKIGSDIAGWINPGLIKFFEGLNSALTGVEGLLNPGSDRGREGAAIWDKFKKENPLGRSSEEAQAARDKTEAERKALGVFGPGGGEAQPLKVGGTEVSSGNPLPVKITQAPSESEGVGGFWNWLTGGSSKSIAASPNSGGVVSSALETVGNALKSPAGGWWTQERMKYAADYLVKNAGLSEMGAAGLVARWSAIEAPGGPDSVNPKSGARGIAQWLGPRQRGMGTTFEEQLAHAAYELNNDPTWKKSGDLLRAAQTKIEGAVGASSYERAEHYNMQSMWDDYTDKTPVQDVYDKLYGGGSKNDYGDLAPRPGYHWDNLKQIQVPDVASSAAGAAALNNIGNEYHATTSSTSNSMHVDNLHLNLPNVKDAQGFTQGLQPALAEWSTAQYANSGPQ